MSLTRWGSSNTLKFVVIQCLVWISEHGDQTIAPPLGTASRTKSATGASLVQKRSHIQKQTQGIVDEDDEDHESGNAMNVQLAPKVVSTTKRNDNAKADEAPKTSKERVGAHDETQSSNDTIALPNVAKSVDDGLNVSMVGNLSNPNASGAHDYTNSSRHDTSSKWLSWVFVASDRCFNTLYRIGSEVLSSLDWRSRLRSNDEEELKAFPEEGSILLVCFGIILAAVILGIFFWVNRLTGRIEETEDSSTSWFRELDASSPFSSQNRQIPWYFQILGFGWTSRFTPKPMPPYSVKRGLFTPGA